MITKSYHINLFLEFPPLTKHAMNNHLLKEGKQIETTISYP